MNQMNVESAQN